MMDGNWMESNPYALWTSDLILRYSNTIGSKLYLHGGSSVLHLRLIRKQVPAKCSGLCFSKVQYDLHTSVGCMSFSMVNISLDIEEFISLSHPSEGESVIRCCL